MPSDSPATSVPSPKSPRYIVEDILPAEEVHIVAGPSGAGKTTWLFQMMGDWIAGAPIAGCTSRPSAWLYVACDRSKEATKRTLERTGVALPVNHLISLVDSHESSMSALSLFNRCRTRLPEGGVVFVDGLISLLAGNPNDYQAVRSLLVDLTRGCKRDHLTIVATTHATKTREGERFLNPRQRILGSVAFGGFSDTVILIEPADQENPENGERTVLILPRNSAPLKLDLAFNKEGKLEPSKLGRGAACGVVLGQWIIDTPGMTPFNVADFDAWAAAHGVSRASARRWLKEQEEKGTIQRVSYGVYVIIVSQASPQN